MVVNDIEPWPGSTVVLGDPGRLQKAVTLCRWMWVVPSLSAGAVALIEGDRGAFGSLTVGVVGVAVVGAAASLSLWARRQRLMTLSLATGVAVCAPLAAMALFALAIVGDFPHQAEMARRYWFAYPVMVAVSFVLALGPARTDAAARVSAMMAALSESHTAWLAAERLVVSRAAIREGSPFWRSGSLGVLGGWVGGLVAMIVGRGAYFWGLSLVMVSLATVVATYVAVRHGYAAAALRGRDQVVASFPRARQGLQRNAGR